MLFSRALCLTTARISSCWRSNDQKKKPENYRISLRWNLRSSLRTCRWKRDAPNGKETFVRKTPYQKKFAKKDRNTHRRPQGHPSKKRSVLTDSAIQMTNHYMSHEHCRFIRKILNFKNSLFTRRMDQLKTFFYSCSIILRKSFDL